MRVPKPLLYANAAALTLNGIIIALMAVRVFPPVLGIALILAFLAASVWLSCLAQGKLPKKKRPAGLYAAPTEHMETL